MPEAHLVPLAITLLAVLTILLPIWGVRDYRTLLRRVHEGRPDARLVSYAWTIAVQWALTIGFLAWWRLSGGELAPLRLVPTAQGWQWPVVGVGVAVLVFSLFQMATVLRSPEQLDQVRRQSGELCELAPRSPRERRAFDLMAITAGICEEILYRGLLLAVLAAGLGTWPAVVLSSAIFGVGHAYQGGKGVAKTGAVGLVMALLAVGSGSLFVPMLVHAVVDLTGGRILDAASRAAPAGCDAGGAVV